MSDVQTKMLPFEQWKRGPGGHWFNYRAWRDADPSKEGYGQTALEAVKDLRSKM